MSEISAGDVVVRVKAETTDFTRGLEQALQAMTQFQQRLTGTQGPLSQFQQALPRGAQAGTQALQHLNVTLTQTGTALTQARTQAEGFGQTWRGILQVASGVGIATSVSALVSTLKDFAVSTVETGTRLESLRNSLSALAGSAATGREQFDQLFQTAQRLGVPFETLARGFRTLTAAATQAGLPMADQRRLLEAVTTEGRRLGLSNEALERVFLALGQAASKGKFAMEELRQQIAEAMPTALAAMARGLGRTTEELEKLVASGLSFTTGAGGLTRGFEALQALGGKVADGLREGFNKFNNELTRTKDILIQDAAPALTALAAVGEKALKTLNAILTAQGQLAEARAGEGRLGTGLRAGDVARLDAPDRRRLAELNRLIGEQTEAQADPNAAPMFQPSRAQYLQQLRDERAALFAKAEAIKAASEEEVKATEVTNKARTDAENQARAIADITKQIDALTTVQEDFRRKAALSPALFGRPGGTLAEQATFQQGLQAATRPELEKLTSAVANVPPGVTIPPETGARLRELDVGYGRIGQALDGIKDKQQAATKAAREAEQARLADIREQAQEQKQRIQGLARDLDIFGLLRSPEEEADLKAQVKAQHDRMQEFAKTLDIFGLELSPEQERQRRAGTAFDQRLQAAIEQQQATRAARPEARLRAEAAKQGIALTPEQEGQLAQLTALREEQERLNEELRVYNEAADAVGNSWTSALTSIADHTKTVSGAFRDMARSIAQSLAQIAMQEGFRALIRFGAGLITGAATTGATGGVGGDPGPKLFASGGVVNQPTFSMLGERGAEAVVNRSQMGALMDFARSSAPSAGGQAAGPTVHVSNIFVQSQGEADQAKAHAETMGHIAIVSVLNDLSAGSGSRIHRAISTLQR